MTNSTLGELIKQLILRKPKNCWVVDKVVWPELVSCLQAMLVLTSRMCAGLDVVWESNVRYAALFYMVTNGDLERERGRGGEGESQTEGRKGEGGRSDELWIQHLPAHLHTLIQEFRASPGLEWFYPLNTVNIVNTSMF